jgi:hypothetical protein
MSVMAKGQETKETQEIAKQEVPDGWMRMLAHSYVRGITHELKRIEKACTSEQAEEELFQDVMNSLRNVAQLAIGGMANAANDYRFNVVFKAALAREDGQPSRHES